MTFPDHPDLAEFFGMPEDELTLGGLLRRVRRSQDIPQEEAAAGTGLSKSTLSLYEQGRRDIPVNYFARLAKRLNCKLVLELPSGERRVIT